MEISEFKEALMLYGADISSWPASLGKEAAALLEAGGKQTKEIKQLIDEEKGFENLLNERTYEEPGDYLAQRIIAHAEDSSRNAEQRGIFAGLFIGLLTPKTSFALALTLVIGFMIGYMDRSISYDSLDADEFVEESFVDLLMEGDIFE
ncbi:MAG: hypothetical protein V3V95_03655 [Thermodesulfobacteriota bacterium]